MSDIDEMINVAAYYKWKENHNSDPVLNWLVAEREIVELCICNNNDNNDNNDNNYNKINVEYLRSGAQFVDGKEEVNIEAKHLDKNVKLDKFYNNSSL